jgi:sulfate transport system ATP-binding protein
VAGLEVPDAGAVMIDGAEMTAARPQDRGIGFMFQHYAAFTHMSVRENVAFGLRVRKRPRAEVRERVDELLALVGLTKWSEQRPAQLSGGQRQRMALARALAVEPRVLLLDEPFGALDANVRAELRRWLRRMHDEQGVTTVLVTHDQEEAMRVADTLAVMNAGRIEQVGSPREVYDRPATEFVMGFIGPVSRIDGRLVRPHDVAISLAPAEGTIEAQVSRVVHLGFEVRIELELPSRESARAQLTRLETDELELASARGHRVRAPAGGERRTRDRCSAHRVTQTSAHRVTQASGSSASLSIFAGSLPRATSASVTCSTTARRLARTAIQTRGRALDAPS